MPLPEENCSNCVKRVGSRRRPNFAQPSERSKGNESILAYADKALEPVIHARQTKMVAVWPNTIFDFTMAKSRQRLRICSSSVTQAGGSELYSQINSRNTSKAQLIRGICALDRKLKLTILSLHGPAAHPCYKKGRPLTPRKGTAFFMREASSLHASSRSAMPDWRGDVGG